MSDVNKAYVTPLPSALAKPVIKPLPGVRLLFGSMGGAALILYLILALGMQSLLAPLSYPALIISALLFSLVVCFYSYRERQRANFYINSLSATIDRLHAARAQAETANHAKTRFLATMSHEFRTPMSGVLGMIELLRETNLTPEQESYARAVDISGRSLLSLIDEILDSAKIESGHFDVQQKPFDVLALAESVIELIAPRAHIKDIDISCFTKPHVPAAVVGDEYRLRQILFNLCGNSIKFTEQGGIALDVDYDTSKSQLIFTVRDTGIGMCDAELGRIFTEYSQAHAGTQRKFGGTGLGLSISQKLVAGMGGTISASSQPGLGSVFTVRLPAPPVSPVTPVTPATTRDHPLRGQHYELALPAGPTRDHFLELLPMLGAEVSCLEDLADVAQALAPETVSTSILICDSFYASVLRDWAKLPSGHYRKRVWVVMRAEERRLSADLLGVPFAGYLLKPLRRATAIHQLAMDGPKILATVAQNLHQSLTPPPPLASLNILFAEDNPINAMLTKTMLLKMGHRVQHVKTGRHVIAELSQQGPVFDLILMDVEMPDLDGLATTRTIRQWESHHHHPRLPILALTANARREEIAECLAAGMDGHLSKPFDKHSMQDMIMRLVPLKSVA